MSDLEQCLEVAASMGSAPFRAWMWANYEKKFCKSQTSKAVQLSQTDIYMGSSKQLCQYLLQFTKEYEELRKRVGFEARVPEKKAVPKQPVLASTPARKSKLVRTEKKSPKKRKTIEPVEISSSDEELIEISTFEDEPIIKSDKEEVVDLERRLNRFRIHVISEADADTVGKCIELTPLTNFVSSCYMDSILMVLFTVLEDYTFENMIEGELRVADDPLCDPDPGKDLDIRRVIKDAFVDIHQTLVQSRNPTKCNNFRTPLGRCKTTAFETFAITKDDTNIRDAAEFMDFIFRVFGIDTGITYSVVTKKRLRGGEYDEQSFREEVRTGSPMWIVSKAEMDQASSTNDLIKISNFDDTIQLEPIVDGESVYEGKLDEKILLTAGNRSAVG